LLPFNYGENQLTVDYGECLPAIKVHSKDLDNDGEITTNLISTILATNDPITDALLLYGKDSQQSRACIVQANECFHAHVSQVIGIHDKDLDNDGEITTKIISTIATNDCINTRIDRICSSITSPCGNIPGDPSMTRPIQTHQIPTILMPPCLLPTFKHGDSFKGLASFCIFVLCYKITSQRWGVTTFTRE
jgi:hypothetical protein